MMMDVTKVYKGKRTRRYEADVGETQVVVVHTKESSELGRSLGTLEQRLGGPVVTGAVELDLDHSLTVRAHSPTGFEWGYRGSGPSQLALAILLDFVGSVPVAEVLYVDLRDDIVAKFHGDTWELTGLTLAEWMLDKLGELGMTERVGMATVGFLRTLLERGVLDLRSKKHRGVN